MAALRAHRFRPAAADALGIPRSSIYDLIERIPGLRKAAELTREEIAAARERVGPCVEAAAAELEVSERALRRRIGELGRGPRDIPGSPWPTPSAILRATVACQDRHATASAGAWTGKC